MLPHGDSADLGQPARLRSTSWGLSTDQKAISSGKLSHRWQAQLQQAFTIPAELVTRAGGSMEAAAPHGSVRGERRTIFADQAALMLWNNHGNPPQVLAEVPGSALDETMSSCHSAALH